MGLVLELLPKVVVDNENIFGQINYYGNGTSELNYLNANSGLASVQIKKNTKNQNQKFEIPRVLQGNFNRASEKVAVLKEKIAFNKRQKQILEHKLNVIKQKLASNDVDKQSQAIALTGKCGSYEYKNGEFIVPMVGKAGLGAKGCPTPYNIYKDNWINDLSYARNYAEKVLPDEIKKIADFIQKDYRELQKAEAELEAAQDAIDKYIRTQEEYRLKEQEAKNRAEQQRLKEEREARLKELQIEAEQKAKQMELEAQQRAMQTKIQAEQKAKMIENISKNVKIGLFVLGGLGLLYFFKTNK